ncbi:MAG: DUF1800 domain-containing protein [Aggregatilineales bacterium]
MNRREFLKVMGVGAGTTALVGGTEWGTGLIGVLAAPEADAPDPIWHALNRLTYAPTPGQVAAVKQIGLQAYIEQQLAPNQIDDSAVESMLGNYSSLSMTVPELIDQFVSKQQYQVSLQLDAATVIRAIYSPRQLLEVMVNLWSEHFNIWQRKEIDATLKTADDRDVIRKFALGKFRDLLGASAHSPAMLYYLDNVQSNKAHPNENYGRELLELHTLGVGNYTEADVQNVAHAFTGWTIQGFKATDAGTFTFNPKLHDTAAKTVLGHTIPAGGGVEDGEKVLDILAAHPATAKHIATILAHRFIGDNPSDSMIAAIQQAFLQSGGDIAATLRALFALPDFASAGPKYKRPWEYTISMMRALNAQVDASKPQLSLLSILQSMGQLPFDHDMADGYSDVATSWEGNLLTRWNLAINTLYGKMPGIKIDLNSIVTSQNVPIEPTAVIQFFAQHFYGRALTSNESTALMGYMNKNGAPDLTTTTGRQVINDTLALMMAAPAFQYR